MNRSSTPILGAIVQTVPSASALILRVGLGVVMLPHGLQKVFGWFGGGGWSGTMQYLTQNQGIPSGLAVLVILTEFVGPLALLAGCFARIAACAIGIEMTVAALTVHLPRGFFMDWHGKHAGEGYEFHLLAVSIAVAVMIQGAGAFSLDRRAMT